MPGNARKAAVQFRQPHREMIRRFEEVAQDVDDVLAPSVMCDARGAHGRIVRPDGAVVIRHGVVVCFAFSQRADTPAAGKAAR